MFTKEEYQIQYLNGVDLIYHKRQIYAPEVYVDVHTFGIISISITWDVRDYPIPSNTYATGKVLQTKKVSLTSELKNVKPRIITPRATVSCRPRT